MLHILDDNVLLQGVYSSKTKCKTFDSHLIVAMKSLPVGQNMQSVCTAIGVIPSSISITFMGFERVYQGTSHNVSIRGIGQIPAKQVHCSEIIAMH